MTEPAGYRLAVLDHIRVHGPIVPARWSPASQCARAAGVTITRAQYILDRLEAEGWIEAVRVPPRKRGRGRIVRLEVTK